MNIYGVEVNDGDFWCIFDRVEAMNEEQAVELVYENCEAESDDVEIISVWKVEAE